MISKSQEETEVSWRLEEKAGGPVKKLDLDIVHRESIPYPEGAPS